MDNFINLLTLNIALATRKKRLHIDLNRIIKCELRFGLFFYKKIVTHVDQESLNFLYKSISSNYKEDELLEQFLLKNNDNSQLFEELFIKPSKSIVLSYQSSSNKYDFSLSSLLALLLLK